MNSKIPKLILNTPILCQLGQFCYGKLFFYGARGRFYGIFNSLEEAKELISSGCPSSYADTDLTDVNIDSFSQIHLFDYPVMLRLLMAINQAKHLIDFGGHIGVKYYAYKRLLPDIQDLIWKVVDVPFCVERGRREALQRGATNLSFSSDISEAGDCDLLLISGTLQYVTPSIGDLLDSMACLPRFIIINKLPLHFGSDCYTIENFGNAKIPYRIFNKDKFDLQLLNRAYNKVDTWTIPSREISIPFHEKKLDKFVMEGQVWEKNRNL
jgi:putative methyltransferase (TIGR04325 family)